MGEGTCSLFCVRAKAAFRSLSQAWEDQSGFVQSDQTLRKKGA
jgi:hypothetical protein